MISDIFVREYVKYIQKNNLFGTIIFEQIYLEQKLIITWNINIYIHTYVLVYLILIMILEFRHKLNIIVIIFESLKLLSNMTTQM